MKLLSRSTDHRILDPRVAALVLAALRLNLHNVNRRRIVRRRKKGPNAERS